jgi:outer membrane biosynthesis protein TonB
MIRAEIEANNVQAQKLAEENGAKIAQNVAAGVVGVVIWPVWFAMDAKGAAGTEMDALKARQQYLSSLAEQRCAPQPAPPPPPPHVAAKPKPKPKPAPPPAPAAAPAPPAAQSPN